MGYRLAEEAARRGHIVTLISGPVKLLPPENIYRFIQIRTLKELRTSLKKIMVQSECLIMCAAVADFRVKRIRKKKIRRRRKRLLLELVPTNDIIGELSKYKKRQLFVGFSLETEDLVRNSIRKLKDKKLDIIVANRLSKYHNPFGDNKLDVLIIDKDGRKIDIKNKTKPYIAQVLLDKIEQLWYLKRKDIV